MNLEKANKYLQWIGEHYDEQKKKLKAFCSNKSYKFDDDVFAQTYMNIYEHILRSGIQDDSDNGFDNYTFKAFKQNMHRESMYSRNAKRDDNVSNITDAYERYCSTLLSEREKLKSDLFKDYATLYLLSTVEQKFDGEHFYLFRLKTFENNLTYKQLQEKTGIKGCRQKIVDVKNYLKNNVSKEEIKREFDKTYGNLL